MSRSPAASAPVDLGVLDALLGNDPVAVAEVLAAFRTSTLEIRDGLRVALAAGSMRRVADGAHKLRSAAQSIGAAGLGDLCAAAEVRAERGQVDAAAAAIARLDEEIEAVLCCLGAIPQRRPSTGRIESHTDEC
ncbi:MAG: Hpt domain-containing protein [Variovorax sp.]